MGGREPPREAHFQKHLTTLHFGQPSCSRHQGEECYQSFSSVSPLPFNAGSPKWGLDTAIEVSLENTGTEQKSSERESGGRLGCRLVSPVQGFPRTSRNAI